MKLLLTVGLTMISRRQMGYALVILWSCWPLMDLDGWDRIITFNDFEAGTFEEPNAAIAQVVRVVRDEGFEVEPSEGFARHHLADDGEGGLMYSLTTGGHGWSWGQVFAAIPLDPAIEERGTLYFQFAMEGTGSHSLILGLSPESPDPVDPPPAENPWGWSGMGDWSGFATQLRNDNGSVGVRDGLGQPQPGIFEQGDESFRWSALEWVPGIWYEVWITVNTSAEWYSIYLRAPEAGVSEQTLLHIWDEDSGLGYKSEYYFRRPADSLRSIYLGMIAGEPDEPNVDHRWWINNIAVDFEKENLSNPPVPLPGAGVPVDHRIFGFRPVEGSSADEMRADASGMLGEDAWFGNAPYVYSFGLERWMFSADLVNRDPERTNFAARRGTWIYIWDSPFDGEAFHFSELLGTWLYALDGGWSFVWSSR